MDSIPAKIAGCKEICITTPPSADGKVNPVILAAAKIAGVDRIFKVGGAQAVAALAYGTETVPKVDKIVGPGNAFVAEAKRQVFGRVSIDMIAGPSEILVIADGKSDPSFVAADLLSQAEHDRMASAVLVTDSEDLAVKVQEEIEKQLRFVQNGIKLMEDKIIQAEKEKAVIESSITPPSTLYEKAEASYKKLTQASSRLEAIELAIELIEKASEEMKASLAPKITSYASELFSIATDGKYQALNVTTELSLTTDNGETVKSAEYLSAGARATAYICLRLALLKAVYNDTLPPIIFDDAFVRLDKTRIEQIFKAIMASPAKDAQIFVFSATDI
jgi:histidinol dehydrogenase